MQKKPTASQAASVELELGLMLRLWTVSAASGTLATHTGGLFYIFMLIIKHLFTLSELRF